MSIQSGGLQESQCKSHTHKKVSARAVLQCLHTENAASSNFQGSLLRKTAFRVPQHSQRLQQLFLMHSNDPTFSLCIWRFGNNCLSLPVFPCAQGQSSQQLREALLPTRGGRIRSPSMEFCSPYLPVDCSWRCRCFVPLQEREPRKQSGNQTLEHSLCSLCISVCVPSVPQYCEAHHHVQSSHHHITLLPAASKSFTVPILGAALQHFLPASMQ